MSTAIATLTERQASLVEMIEHESLAVIGAMPMDVPKQALKRARARMRVAFYDAIRSGGKLPECTPHSLGHAVCLSALTGLFPGGHNPDVWLIPRKNKHTKALEANWQVSWRGYVRLARRAGWELEPVLVFEGDDFELNQGSEPWIRHKPKGGPGGWDAIAGAYVRVWPMEHGRDPLRMRLAYLTKKQIAQRRAKAIDDSIWREWPEEQALKTACAYAGQRELFPCDPAARMALESDVAAAEPSAPVETGAKELMERLETASPAAEEPEPAKAKKTGGRITKDSPKVERAPLAKQIEAIGRLAGMDAPAIGLALERLTKGRVTTPEKADEEALKVFKEECERKGKA